MYLRVPQRTLTDIETRYLQAHGLNRCKEEVLRAWLQRTPEASWKELVDALRQIDEIALASRLEYKYCQLSSFQSGDSSASVGRENKEQRATQHCQEDPADGTSLSG